MTELFIENKRIYSKLQEVTQNHYILMTLTRKYNENIYQL